MNTIIGAQAGTANTNYSTEPFVASLTDSATYPYQMIVDACVQAEAAIAQAVGQTVNHPWRQFLFGATVTRLSGDLLAGTPLIAGLLGFGNVRSSTGVICTERPLEDIVRRNRNAGSFFTLPVYFYRMADNRVYHTLTTGTPPVPAAASIDYYKYDIATSYAQTPNGTPIFPSSAIAAYVAGAVSFLLKEDEYPATAQHYAGIFQQLITQIITGYQVVDPAQPSAPITGSQVV